MSRGNGESPAGELAAFYDAWAGDYDAVHADWRAAVVHHGELFAEVLAARGIGPGSRVLDCTCGIGTQAIGLALAGYSVAGSDLSPAQIERARREAAGFGVDVAFAVADLLQLGTTLPDDPAWREFDAVITANSLTHLAEPGTLRDAFAAMASVTRPGGIVAVMNRDYDALAEAVEQRPTATLPQRSAANGVERVSFQLWRWGSDGRSYRMEDVLLTRPAGDEAAPWQTRSRATTLQAWRRGDIEAAARAAGLVDVSWTQRWIQPIASCRV